MTPIRLVIASNNRKKRDEIAAALVGCGLEVVPQHATRQVEVVEDGATFADNAAKKAEAFAAANRLPALADDSGLCVDTLGGAPGVYSSRYAGTDGDDAANNAKLLQALVGEQQRRAHFVCHLHLAFVDGRPPLLAEGRVDGEILEHPDGEQGFGYDPIFFSTELGISFAHASAAQKASVSHRGRALRDLVKKLQATMTDAL